VAWKVHSDHLTPKLTSAWYVIGTLKQIMSQGTLIMINYAYFHSLMTQGIIFWDNSPYSIHIFRFQEKIKTITNSKNGYSCRNLFKNLFSRLYQHTFLLLSWVIIVESNIQGEHRVFP